jgi:hypothetical protein
LKSKKISLKTLGTVDFNEIWLARSLLHLIARENKFPTKEDQKFEPPLKIEFGLIFAIV